MTITSDTRLAWALARDNGMRSQHDAIREKLEMGCDVQFGIRGGIGAGVWADYARVHACIAALPVPVQSVGDALNCRGVLSDTGLKKAQSLASLSIAQIAIGRLPGYGQWSPERQRLMYWVAQAALERVWVKLYAYPEKLDYKGREEGRTLDEPWKVAKWLRGKHGQKLDLKNWGKQWEGPWHLLQDVIYELDDSGIEAVDFCIGNQKKKIRALRG